jgi:allantoin racemase
MTRILWINPVGTDLFDDPIQDLLEQIKRANTSVEVVSLARGPQHLEYHYYESLILTDLLHEIKRAENEGFAAAVIGCFYDPGLREAREIAEQIVVTAPAESTLLLACSLGHKFSIVVGRDKWIPKMEENVVRYGLRDRLASMKSVDMGVHDFQADPSETEARLKAAAQEAVEKDGAEVIILGCTIEFGFFRQLQSELKVPVLDAVVAPFKYAEFLVEVRDRFGWMHSKVQGYESPPLTEIASWGLEEQYGCQGLWQA